MPQTEPFLLFTNPLREHGIRYMISGSVASIYYGEPRLTNDVDIVLWLTPDKIDALIHSFPLETFYCPPRNVIAEEIDRSKRGHCNLIHHQTGFKADLYFVKHDPLHIWGLSHVQEGTIDHHAFQLAPPEYVITRKLEFFREGGAQKHLRDIHRMLICLDDDLDTEILENFIRERGLEREWAQARACDQ